LTKLLIARDQPGRLQRQTCWWITSLQEIFGLIFCLMHLQLTGFF